MRKLNFVNDKKGNILAENIIFIVLNLVFLAILILFLFLKTGSAAVIEEKYAKQIALALDSAEPGMVIRINMEDAVNTAEKEGIEPRSIVSINENVVNVKLRDKGGYSYSFFNDIKFDGIQSNYYFNTETQKGFVFVIN